MNWILAILMELTSHYWKKITLKSFNYLSCLSSRSLSKKCIGNSSFQAKGKSQMKVVNDVIFPEEYFSPIEKGIGRNIEETKKGIGRNLTVPNFRDKDRKVVQTAAGLYLTNTAVAWAKMSCDYQLLEWNIIPIQLNVKKWHIVSLYEMVENTFCLLPKSDVFVIEDTKNPSCNQTSNQILLSNVHMMQCTTALILFYLNKFHSSGKMGDECQHKVYFLKSFVPARLSATLVGGERVSAQTVVKDVLNNSKNTGYHQFSTIRIDSAVKENYFSKQAVERECMCQALLLTMSFMDLVIHEKRESLKYLDNLSK